jgi:predicted negative regulator of RcsB-dependent stress response
MLSLTALFCVVSALAGGWCGWRIGRWQTDGDAAAARVAASVAFAGQQKAERERDEQRAAVEAIRAELASSERARQTAVDEANDLRRRLADAAVPGSVREDLQKKFGGGA